LFGARATFNHVVVIIVRVVCFGVATVYCPILRSLRMYITFHSDAEKSRPAQIRLIYAR
jgi:hypothetical protein